MAAFTYIRGNLWFFIERVCIFTPAVIHFGRFVYEISAQFCHNYIIEPLCSPRDKSILMKQSSLKHRTITVKSRKIQIFKPMWTSTICHVQAFCLCKQPSHNILVQNFHWNQSTSLRYLMSSFSCSDTLGKIQMRGRSAKSVRCYKRPGTIKDT